MKISDQIIEVLNYLCEKIGFTIDWTADNVLPYVETLFQKFIKWEISTSWMWIGVGAAMILLALIPTILMYINCCLDGFEWFVYGVVVVIAFLIIGVQVYDIITCYTFPEKVIYDYIKNLVDSGAYR